MKYMVLLLVGFVVGFFAGRYHSNPPAMSKPQEPVESSSSRVGTKLDLYGALAVGQVRRFTTPRERWAYGEFFTVLEDNNWTWKLRTEKQGDVSWGAHMIADTEFVAQLQVAVKQ